MKFAIIEKRILAVLTAAAFLSACAKSGSTDDGNSGGSGGGFRKVNLASASTSAVEGEPVTKELVFTGDQVNIHAQLVKPGSSYMIYACEVNGFTNAPTLQLTSARLAIDLTDASQVNCAMGIPVNSGIRVENASQVNLYAVVGGGDITVTNSSQVNVYLAFKPGVQYRFAISGIQMNTFGCASYTTNDAAAGSLTIQSSAQGNIYCLSEAQADWLLSNLADPDPIPVKTIDGRLLF